MAEADCNKMLRSPSSLILNRTKTCSMYEVRGRLVGLLAVIAVFVVIIPYIIPSSHDTSQVVELKPNTEQIVATDRKLETFKAQRVEIDIPQGIRTDIYAVVFDAGSTGSRVHVYQFKSGNGPLKLVKELFKEVKPGLSNYADNPKKGAESLRELLNIAIAEVPSELQSKTPINLMATAGLRLLQEGVADNLLNEVQLIMKEYPFRLADDAVDIMEGTDEGVYSWMTVAFLTGDLKSSTSAVAALDMGGGSTQVTFVPTEQETLTAAPKDFSKTIELFQKKINLYTHSYLGYGLMSTRYRLLGGKKNKDNKEKLRSVCLPPKADTLWPYGGVVFNVSGEPTSSFNSCYSIVKSFVMEKILPIGELQKHKIYIFSYFFDAAKDSGLIDPDVQSDITADDFRKAAKTAFNTPNEKHPFLGLDLLYMYSLLTDGYRLTSKTKLTVIKKLQNVEVSWGLGAAFRLLSSSGLIS